MSSRGYPSMEDSLWGASECSGDFESAVLIWILSFYQYSS